MQKPLCLFLIFISLFQLTGCNQKTRELQEEQAANASVTILNSRDFELLINKQPVAQLIDVRTAEEFHSGHLANAYHIDFYHEEFSNQLALLKKNEPVFVYCAVGGRSARAACLLEEQGFTQIFDLQGGIKAWQNSGKKIIVD
jgi:rhodanese-related sulfurtransferase